MQYDQFVVGILRKAINRDEEVNEGNYCRIESAANSFFINQIPPTTILLIQDVFLLLKTCLFVI